MTLFDSRNVLDRLEATWKGIFNTNWKSNISPFLILLAVNITGGILSAIATPLMLVLASLTVSSAFGKGILIALVLFLLVCAIVSFYWITANLAEISTYLIFEKQAHHIPFRGMDILREAKTYLSSALRFDGYYYSILAVIILVIFLLLYPFIRDDIGLLFQIDATNYTSNTYLEHFLQMLGIGLFVGGGYSIFALWFSTRYLPTKPGFVLSQSGNYHIFSNGRVLTKGHFWDILGNMMVLSIAISLVSGIWNNFIGGSLFGGSLPSVEGLSGESIDAMMQDLPKLLSYVSPGPIGGGMIITVIASTLTNLYRNGFSYILWKDLSTPIVGSIPPPENSEPGVKVIE